MKTFVGTGATPSPGTAVVDRIAALGLIPVVDIPDPAMAVGLADALRTAGLPCVEITLRTPAGVAAIEVISRDRPDLMVGAGTVLTVDQVDAVVGAGARFVVSPGLDPVIVERCLERSVAVIPGVATATEVQLALSLGLDVVKFFPAEAAGGVPYIRALAAPFRRVRFVPTGGIDMSNLARYLAVLQVVAVGGSWITPRDLVAAGSLDAIEARAREALRLVARLRGPEGPSAAGAGSDRA
jgi:2-dehydro-3-deoxyphosphogluconate aldolase/(4S)-4-hydroxy-2-oxoglutarate aldolase